ncbi:peptidase inhibitor 15-A-like [Centruroides sculpturatus]|uniref:peptidase inhibitor 15-A-like n=1 Tax=Centruroides sculpturatus TaxID=218467 RepID=UPI000C6DDA03|nr:peptidase inhibitor 15-A-like [Centruroides sculpturatus]XP_023231199.1 peptidase inhibitor 15-A-like [Centruroides sculpturatus]
MIRSVLVLVLFGILFLNEKCIASTEDDYEYTDETTTVDPPDDRQPVALSDSQKKDMLRMLNNVRRHPPATTHKMIKLMWNEKLAKFAGERGRRCPDMLGPPNCLKFMNQNLDRGKGIFAEAVNDWNTRWTYNYTGNACDYEKLGCLYYKTLFWAESYYVGCSLVYCRYFNVTTCYFYPGGDRKKLLNESPFEEGEPGCKPELCPPQAQKCDTEDPDFSLCEMTSFPEIPDSVLNCALKQTTPLVPETSPKLHTSTTYRTTDVDTSGFKSASTVMKESIIKLALFLVMMITNSFYM